MGQRDAERSSSLGWRGVGALVLLAGLGLGEAHAIAVFPPNPGVLPGGGWQFTPGTTFGDPVSTPRTWNNGVYGTPQQAVVKVTDTVRVSGPAGPLDLGVSRVATLNKVGKAAAACLMMANPTCFVVGAIGLAAVEAFDRYRIRNPAGDPGALMRDAGAEPTTGDAWCAGSGYCTHPSAQSAAEAYVDRVYAPTGQCFGDYKVQSNTAVITSTPNATTAYYKNMQGRTTYQNWGCTGGTGFTTVEANAGLQTWVSGTTTQCPASTGFTHSVPAGEPVGLDGKCRTGTYTTPITADQAATEFAANPPTDPAAVARNAVEGGQEIESEWAPVTGPASQTGTPTSTTTTGPNGTTTKTTTPTYNYDYSQPGKVVYGNTTVTNTCIGAGACSAENATETTTTTTGPAPSPEKDPEDPCTSNPDRVGCQKLGTAPTDAVPKLDRTLTYGVEDVQLPSGCPSPTVIEGKAFSWAPICDAATAARPWVLVGAAFSALMLCLVSLRAT